jgi:hypothetical protein
VIFPRHLPPSELIIRGAPDAQVAHALCWLSNLYLRKRLTHRARLRVFSDTYGALHRWLDYMDAGTVDGWPFGRERKLEFARRLRLMERSVGWIDGANPQ